MKILEEVDRYNYDSFVSQVNGSFLQSWDWGEFKKSQGEDLFRFILQDNKQIVLLAQMVKIKFKSKEYFYIPYGPLVIRQEEFLKYFKIFCEQLKKIFPKILFVRFEAQSPLNNTEKHIKKTVDINPHKTLILNLFLDEQTLLAQMKQKTRYNIKVAQKHGVKVSVVANEANAAINLIINSSKRAGVHAFPKKYYQDLLNFFSDEKKQIQAKLYIAWHEGDLLAANMMLYHKDRVIYLFGGSADIKRNLMAPYILHHQAILDARAAGYKKYDFWGIEENPNHPWHGFSKFKLGFGGDIVDYAGTYDFIFNTGWYNIYIGLRKLNRIIRR